MVAGLQGWPLSPAHKTGAAHNRLAVSGHFRSRQETFRPEHDGGKYQPTGLKCLSPLTRFPNTARPGYEPWQRRFLFAPYTIFSAMVPENVTNKTFHLFVANDMFFFRIRGGFFVAGWGLCYTTPSCQRLRLWTPPKRSALRFSRFQKYGKNRHEKSADRHAPRWS